MPYSRIAGPAVDTAVLGEPLTFRHGKQAVNRIMKSPMSEKMYNYDQYDDAQRGLPTEEIINLYSHWGHGGYGIMLTGNLGVDPKYIGEGGQGLVTFENTNEEKKNPRDFTVEEIEEKVVLSKTVLASWSTPPF